jgi:hypothetical protein
MDFSYQTQFLSYLCRIFYIDYLKVRIATAKVLYVLVLTNMQGTYYSHFID